MNVNDSKLREFDFNIETLEVHEELKDIKLDLLQGNYDDNYNSDFDLNSVFFQMVGNK